MSETPRVVVVAADFYPDIAAGLLASCRAVLDAAGVQARVEKVGGALEIPPALNYFAESAACMVALGCVIRGETYHFEVVADTSAQGIMQVQLQTGTPVGNGILTVDNEQQARARLDKGAAAARAALSLARLLRRL